MNDCVQVYRLGSRRAVTPDTENREMIARCREADFIEMTILDRPTSRLQN